MNEHPSKILARLEQHAKKRFGQNFLVHSNSLDRIATLAKAGPGTRVIEIGPGLGALSRTLLARGAAVRAVEIDTDLASFLEVELPDLELIRGDALQVDWAQVADGEGWTVCANVPYKVATAIVTHLVTLAPRFSRLVLMFQLEVAKRLVAQPGTSAYGSLSVHIQAHADARLAFTLPPGAFHPAPKVKSGVVVLEPRIEPRTGGCDPAFFQSVVKAGFSQRRKTLRNALGTRFDRNLVIGVLEETGHLGKRAERLSLEDWGVLSAALRDAIRAV
ncbi:MAG: 16S rRNA (adenine(1518)-N(6)/adenine(1519)-N(6))-dimethyltransferase RsmA [Myxococcota bacterium]|nr:16S rRNA (adenine(1518)-N(6)/adenine(1519)-N(6))-dimethyltransferase RsmA [Myxococcota bacterium]